MIRRSPTDRSIPVSRSLGRAARGSFTDQSDAKAYHPVLDRLLDGIPDGDTRVVWKLDCLGRSVQNLVA